MTIKHADDLDRNNIQSILTEILALNDCANLSVSLEKPLDDVDPLRFNRARVTMDDHEYGVSVFVANTKLAEKDTKDLAEGFVPKTASDVTDQDDDPEDTPSKFNSDFRVSNPKLHELYVGWARQTIQVTQRMCRELWDQSRWPASDIAAQAWSALIEHIKTDAAWFEAAALEFMEPDGDFVQGPTILAGESLRGIPPGEFEGVIVEREGKLYFELSDNPVAAG